MAAAEKEGLESKFKLTSQISTSNMVCFDRLGRIKKYTDVNDMLVEFCDVRKEFYQKRKEHLLNQLTIELTRLDNRVRFVSEIISGKLIVQNRKKTDIIQELKTRGYDPMLKTKSADAGDEESVLDAAKNGDHGYDYLMSMPIWNLTWEKVQSLLAEKKGKESEVKFLIGQTVHDLWRTDLDAFLAQWESFEVSQAQLESTRPGQSGGPKKALNLKKPKAKKKLNSDGESELSLEEMDEDFRPSQKKIVKVLMTLRAFSNLISEPDPWNLQSQQQRKSPHLPRLRRQLCPRNSRVQYLVSPIRFLLLESAKAPRRPRQRSVFLEAKKAHLSRV